ncbi:hypothetical protein K1W69_17260 [Hoeflea sp. WL0058]|uniref:Uncharacterized protein n=1 Tax=Flavimaribacter sediminis TaxID=2865987 RepID=A0AAE3D2V5_9HYPH|nr:hypothetical protein [Flavimaribacter sediminis]MBW8638948.1 hypothetical protein [Flavimaribacter sediminis]
MTLLIWGVNHRMAWMAGDNRYYLSPNRKFDSAKKVFAIEAANARGLIGYAGVGARVQPDNSLLEVSSWLENLFDGHGFTLEQALEKIRDAAIKRKFGALSGFSHSFAFAGYHEGKPLSVVLMSKPESGAVAVTEFHPQSGNTQTYKVEEDYKPISSSPANGQTVGGRLGSGARFVTNRDILLAARIMNTRKVDWQAARRVQAYLARMIVETSRKEGNRTVGPECFFAVRYARSGGFHGWNPKNSPNNTNGILPGISMGGWKNTVFHGLLFDTLMKPMLEAGEKLFSDKAEDKEAIRKRNEDAAKEFTDRINKVIRKPSDDF